MAFGTKKTPTLTEKLAGVTATKEAALSVFAVAANDLDGAYTEAEAIYADAAFQIGHLREVQDAAAVQAAEASAKARLIRESFLGG